MKARVWSVRTPEQIAEQEARFRVAMHLRAHPEADHTVFHALEAGRTWLRIWESLSIPAPTAALARSPRPGRTTASPRRKTRAARAANDTASGRAAAAGAA